MNHIGYRHICKYLYFNLSENIFHKLEFGKNYKLVVGTWLYTAMKENSVITDGKEKYVENHSGKWN
jgi:hypothetical protein